MSYGRLIQNEHAHLEDLEALSRVALLASTAPDVESLIQRVGEAMARSIAADSYTLYLLDPSGQRLEAAAAWGSTPQELELFATIPLSQSMTSQVVAAGSSRSFLTDDYPPAVRALVARTRFRAGVAVALKIRARVLGCINLGFHHARLLEGSRVQLLEVMAAHLAEALESQRLLRQQDQAGARNAALYAELRASSADLSRARVELAEKARLASLGELAAVLAHELRNPLQVLANVLALLGRESSNPQAPELLRAGTEEVARMNALVGDLLDFARPSAPNLALQPLGPLLAEVAEAARAQTSAGVQVATAIDPLLPPLLLDRRRMRQALLNLAVNGVQAMRGPGTVTLRARGARDHVRVEVHDEGEGIDERVRPRLFQPFFTTKSTGTGLGLALVHRVVTQHGGAVEVLCDAETPGTTFVVELPLPGAP